MRTRSTKATASSPSPALSGSWQDDRSLNNEWAHPRPGPSTRYFSPMELIPRPDLPGSAFVVSAASNVAHKVLYGGLADLRPMPRTLIDEGELREVYHYRPVASARQHGDPVLLV